MGFAVRKVLVKVEAAAELGVCVPATPSRAFDVPSSLEGSGVVGLLLCVLKFGRSKDVRDGEGGSGVGGRL